MPRVRPELRAERTRESPVTVALTIIRMDLDACE